MSQQLIANRYQIIRPIGRGGMGVVYEALDRLAVGHKPVALKQVTAPRESFTVSLSITDRSQADPRVMLAQEFKTLAALRHPNIISVLDYGFDDLGQPFFTMELLEAPQSILEAGRDLPLPDQIDLLAQMLDALAYLHQRGIVHRDLKPGNIQIIALSDGRRCVKLLDFGLAAAQGLDDAGSPLVAGTLAYLAPETLQGAPLDEAADLYAVGVIAFQLFSGRDPFDMTNAALFIEKLLTQPPDLHLLPVSAELSAVVACLLEKDPDARYASARQTQAAFLAAIGLPPPDTRSSRESFLQSVQLVGRAKEMATLTGALERALIGQGSAWLVAGESGVGKSRLLDELRILALVEGALALRGQSVSEGGLPFRQWRDPVRRLLLVTPVDDQEAAILREIVPDIEALIERPIPTISRLEGQEGAQRLSVTIGNLIARVTQPMVLLLEDLHWASESLAPLRYLNQFVERLPLLIVGSYRDDERHGLAAELPGMNFIKLERFTYEDIAALTQAMLGDITHTAPVVELLAQETEGNAFFIVEIVRALIEDGSDLSGANLPSQVFAGGIQAFIERRLARLRPEANWLLEIAAIFGRQLDRRILERLIALDAYYASVDDWLRHCADAAVLEIHDEQWRFTHDKLREAVRQRIDAARRAELHRHVAEAIEATYPNEQVMATALAEHWLRANDPLRAVLYALHSAEQSMVSGAFADGAGLLRRVLERLPADSYPEEAGLVHLRLGMLYNRMRDYAQAQVMYETGWKLAGQLGRSDLLAEALNGLCFTSAMRGDLNTARRYGREALALAQELKDGRNTASAWSSLGIVAELEGDYGRAQEYHRLSVMQFQAIRDLRGLASSLNNLGLAADNHGDYPAALQHYRDSLDVCREIGYLHGIVTTLKNLGVVAERLSDWRAAERYYREGMETAYRLRDRRTAIHCATHLTYALIQLDYLPDAERLLRQTLSERDLQILEEVAPYLGAIMIELWIEAGRAQRGSGLMASLRVYADGDTDFRDLRYRALAAQFERLGIPPSSAAPLSSGQLLDALMSEFRR